ncbi:protein adenylyltransferase SelO family protein [Candidatus Berkiella aquae]|uniref:Protein nucleotidyltransferase YdiU n=1 Tax=Candidatus Berkiella aquae TaxID=295108 RepID=A0A0Q9YLS7_9GAMM|nr:YdiU family protein [Candidatus Berkiella aquae]MCS5709911.1 YdiU family protein [Candidatus Berkiella aquae]
MNKSNVAPINNQWEHSYLELPNEFYSVIQTQSVPLPEIILWNQPLANELGLENFDAQILSGSVLPHGAKAAALAYAGHQFGYFTLLGDGRAMWLGEQVAPNGKRYDVQLKGSGPTPYARRGDGKATLGPMLREYLISEAMHALKISTTRSLAVTSTGEQIYRGTLQPGAVLTRIAASHIRVGTFEYAATLASPASLQSLLDYTIKRHVPEELQSQGALGLLEYVKQAQVTLICEWLRVGFIHGVMNTDNMAISGQTIDYGPCAFMDEYHPETVFSSIDHHGRYAFANQPNIAQWNFIRLAECLLPFLHENKDKAINIAQQQIEEFAQLFAKQWLQMMRQKLGLVSEENQDELLIQRLLTIMQQQTLDYTNTFRALSSIGEGGVNASLSPHLRDWCQSWQARLATQGLSLQEVTHLMKMKNPALIPRNHQVDKALKRAITGDLSWFNRCLEAYQEPYHDNPKFDDLRQPPTSEEKIGETFCGT